MSMLAVISAKLRFIMLYEMMVLPRTQSLPSFYDRVQILKRRTNGFSKMLLVGHCENLTMIWNLRFRCLERGDRLLVLRVQ